MLQITNFDSELLLFHQATQIPICVFDDTPKDLLRYPIIEAMTCSPHTLSQCANALNSGSPTSHLPMLYSSDTCFFALLKLEPERNIILGPVSYAPITYKEFYNSNKIGCDLQDLLHLYRITQQSPHFSPEQFAANICLFIKMLFQEDIPVINVLKNQISLECCNRIIPLHNPFSNSPIVTKCLQYIHNNIHTKITIDDLAKHCNMSRRTITRHFTEFHHMPVAEYITQLKLKEAVFLLINSEFSLAEISNQLAFSSQSHFTISFKKQFYYTPQQYRDKYKKRVVPKS